MNTRFFESLREDDVVLEALPDDVAATIEARDEWLAKLPKGSDGLEFFVSDLQRWTPGSKVKVAFLGGSTALHRDIAEAAASITTDCSLELDFGFDESTGTYRTWSEDDTTYSADIRVSFDQKGYFSLVGTDSVDANIGHPSSAVGGNAWQRSLNLGGFHIKRPLTWAGTVRHEFLHALAFKHEHQNFRGPCSNEFRWEDDAGYEPTTDAEGRYTTDAAGRRPGIYTFLKGFPNQWNRAKVDHNLRSGAPNEPGMTASEFDDASVMLYRFPPLFYLNQPSPCAPSTDGQDLSTGDRKGLGHLYPSDGSTLAYLAARSTVLADLVDASTASAPASAGLESFTEDSGTGSSSPLAARAVEVLRGRSAALS